ncbi:hypothetical protein LV82_02430 [Albidovulum inexpectatum]|uniref:Lipoprotein n=1 Tax=Albidovulum inexpectatum TaxID=196587 RepID=A0A2S5JEH6_9RHOB|nr:hypothetical protein [Albidovulum inexpectatum]PPB79873.1 hypothetical protein LV82_02430 [Albidovulum inexpectatum]
MGAALHRWRGVFLALLVASCVSVDRRDVRDPDIVRALQAAIADLSSDVLPEEAARAAHIAHDWPLELARRYRVTDPPLIHNTKVNLGLRERGLCWHWAEDMQRRLQAEQFRSLEIRRAIALPSGIGIDHSTAVIVARGRPIEEGIVIDPWRWGGRLFWAPVAKDVRYRWQPQEKVLAQRRVRLQAGFALSN